MYFLVLEMLQKQTYILGQNPDDIVGTYELSNGPLMTGTMPLSQRKILESTPGKTEPGCPGHSPLKEKIRTLLVKTVHTTT